MALQCALAKAPRPCRPGGSGSGAGGEGCGDAKLGLIHLESWDDKKLPQGSLEPHSGAGGGAFYSITAGSPEPWRELCHH